MDEKTVLQSSEITLSQGKNFKLEQGLLRTGRCDLVSCASNHSLC